MATYYVNSAAAGTNAGTSWTNAYTAFGSAITAATTAGDVILVHYTHQEELGVDTIYSFGADIFILSVNKDSSDAPTVMGTGGWVGNSTTNRSVTFSGVDRSCYVYGITLRIAGSTGDNLNLTNSAGQDMTYEACYFWQGNTFSAGYIVTTNSAVSVATFIDCTFRFGHVSQRLYNIGQATIIGGSISSSGSTPTGLCASTAISELICIGFDISLITGTLVPNTTSIETLVLDRCKLGAGVTILAAQTSNPTKASGHVYVFDCHSGDTHGIFGYYDALGQVTSDTGIYYTTGAAAQSWKIVTTSYATRMNPFVTPWVDWYNTGTSAITPYFEILRDGSATAFTDQEVWAEFSTKTTSGSVLPTLSKDRDTTLDYALGSSSSSQANGAGLGSWTGENATAWSGKIDSGSAVTPAEVGALRGRICVAAASTTVYIDPQIRT